MIFALGTFIDNQSEAGSDHAMTIDHGVGSALLPLRHTESSVVVRCELAAALAKFVACYDSSICAIALKYFEEEDSASSINFNGLFYIFFDFINKFKSIML